MASKLQIFFHLAKQLYSFSQNIQAVHMFQLQWILIILRERYRKRTEKRDRDTKQKKVKHR